ncbi:MAG: hypothetical protein F4Y28_09480 [Acidimicrobiia bacterium]|nr:hypothetical protein [Acidimicrobiia bacterium]MYG59385.1 hypothetical protein [Acidimicrobiia bacterium]MYJ32679.1 hypothetical protein [Acidimicrobiia bacterium]
MSTPGSTTIHNNRRHPDDWSQYARRYHSGGTMAGRRFDVQRTDQLDGALDHLEEITDHVQATAAAAAYLADLQRTALTDALTAGATSRQLAQLTGISHVTINKLRDNAGDT